jgi:hypothetical protein
MDAPVFWLCRDFHDVKGRMRGHDTSRRPGSCLSSFSAHIRYQLRTSIIVGLFCWPFAVILRALDSLFSCPSVPTQRHHPSVPPSSAPAPTIEGPPGSPPGNQE